MEVKININGDECYITAVSSNEEDCYKNVDKYEMILYQSIIHIVDSIKKSGSNFKSVMVKLAFDD